MIIDLVDKLADRVIQLVTGRKLARATLLEAHVTPAFAEFELVHAAYLDSFSRYRELIRDAPDATWLQSLPATLERDNLFSANCRSKVVRLAEAEDIDVLAPFVKAISDYVLGARLVDSLGRTAYPHHTQRWRQSLSRTLGEIAEKNWQLVIDPNGARPPLTPEEIEAELTQLRRRYPAAAGTVTAQEALNRACALWALDAVVWEMQNQYDRVCQAYVELKRLLTK
jgi:hypothetical protein